MGEAQKVADELRGKNQPAGERKEQFDHPTGSSDDSSTEDTGVRRSSRQAKEQETPTFRHSSQTFDMGNLGKKILGGIKGGTPRVQETIDTL